MKKKRLAILSLLGIGLAHGLTAYGDTRNVFLAAGSGLQFPSLMLFMYVFFQYAGIPFERWSRRDRLRKLTRRVYALEKETGVREKGDNQ